MVNFKEDLNTDEFGANFSSNAEFANFFCALFFHQKTNKKSTIIPGIIESKIKYAGSSNLYIS